MNVRVDHDYLLDLESKQSEFGMDAAVPYHSYQEYEWWRGGGWKDLSIGRVFSEIKITKNKYLVRLGYLPSQE